MQARKNSKNSIHITTKLCLTLFLSSCGEPSQYDQLITQANQEQVQPRQIECLRQITKEDEPWSKGECLKTPMILADYDLVPYLTQLSQEEFGSSVEIRMRAVDILGYLSQNFLTIPKEQQAQAEASYKQCLLSISALLIDPIKRSKNDRDKSKMKGQAAYYFLSMSKLMKNSPIDIDSTLGLLQKQDPGDRIIGILRLRTLEKNNTTGPNPIQNQIINLMKDSDPRVRTAATYSFEYYLDLRSESQQTPENQDPQSSAPSPTLQPMQTPGSTP